MSLSSPQNPLLKKVRQAAESGRALENGCVVAEGPHLVGEALQSSWTVRRILVTAEGRERFSALIGAFKDIALTEVEAKAFRSISSTEHSQGILALVAPRVWKWRDLLETDAPLVILDGIQDPGNAGTVVRSAEAFGAAGVVFSEGAVRVANTKLLRATAGSIFRLPFLEGVSVSEVVQEARLSRTMLYALAANRQTSLHSLALNGRFAFIVGSEGAGVRPEYLAAGQAVSIPTENVESLNAAVACSIALFEAARQRSQRFLKAL